MHILIIIKRIYVKYIFRIYTKESRKDHICTFLLKMSFLLLLSCTFYLSDKHISICVTSRGSCSINFNTHHILPSRFSVELLALLCARFLSGYRAGIVAEPISQRHVIGDRFNISLRAKSPFKLGNIESILILSLRDT